jgi:hypothetical protein
LLWFIATMKRQQVPTHYHLILLCFAVTLKRWLARLLCFSITLKWFQAPVHHHCVLLVVCSCPKTMTNFNSSSCHVIVVVYYLKTTTTFSSSSHPLVFFCIVLKQRQALIHHYFMFLLWYIVTMKQQWTLTHHHFMFLYGQLLLWDDNEFQFIIISCSYCGLLLFQNNDELQFITSCPLVLCCYPDTMTNFGSSLFHDLLMYYCCPNFIVVSTSYVLMLR